jgi:hypothetical protein
MTTNTPSTVEVKITSASVSVNVNDPSRSNPVSPFSENSIFQWGDSIRIMTDDPFTSVDGVTLVDPDVVTVYFIDGSGTTYTLAYTAGATPPSIGGVVVKDTFLTTSTTSLTVAYGSTGNITVISGLAYVPNQVVRITETANVNNYMIGTVVSYSGTTLVVMVTAVAGSGTYSAWTINLNGFLGSNSGAYHSDVDTSAYIAGVWKAWIGGVPGTSGLDTTKTKKLSAKKSFLVDNS